MNRWIAALLFAPALACGAAAQAAHDASFWIGGDQVFSEAEPGPVVAIGGEVTVSAPVAGGVRVAAGKLTITKEAAISGNVNAAAGEVIMDGSIDGRLHAAAGHVLINGPVKGDASIAAGVLDLGPDARIGGKLTFHGEELNRDPASQVAGGVEHKVGYSRWHDRSPAERFLRGWIWTSGLMLLAALIAAALPGPSNRMADELRQRPWITLGLGFVTLATIPVAAVMLMMTIIGIPIGVFAILGYILLLLMGSAWLAAVAGGMLLDHVKPEVAAVAAWRAGAAVIMMLIIALLVRTPFIGGAAHFLVVVLGIGMITAAVIRKPRAPEAMS